ncbi:MAG: hypothetical protein H6897_10300 [Rhodobacteraceae bacterium]|mgnify:CR=1 FL=1|uniref:hypothetical protein n=1 Tax=Albidovulum sp. TaxID=1872424 RepID=UPI001DD9E90E|nr:hypothetical protein [uncultured Defluviimonas sp.]MCB2127382.1 hypothetical protein [Paracoccaceae bacterium]MCC0070307.1 hypothetical protein [Paracoccaceae bacterium]
MDATLIGSTGAAKPPAALVLHGAIAPCKGVRRLDWIEATMRACEVPSVVDIAKRPDAGQRLTRLLGL